MIIIRIKSVGRRLPIFKLLYKNIYIKTYISTLKHTYIGNNIQHILPLPPKCSMMEVVQLIFKTLTVSRVN